MGLARSDDSQHFIVLAFLRSYTDALRNHVTVHGGVVQQRVAFETAFSRMYRAYFEEVQKSGERLTNGSSYPLTRQGP